jgi:hypothetical protein
MAEVDEKLETFLAVEQIRIRMDQIRDELKRLNPTSKDIDRLPLLRRRKMRKLGSEWERLRSLSLRKLGKPQ